MPCLPESLEINVRSPRFFLAQTIAICWHCRLPTFLVALVLPPGHETLDLGDEAQEDESQGAGNASAAWTIAAQHALLFYVDYLPAAIGSRLTRYLASYRRGTGAGAAGSYWANHCERCGVVLDDHELFCEPEGAFLPTSESRAADIHLVTVDEAFEAAVGGYAYEPMYFDAMARR